METGKEDEEATTNKIDRKWIHDDDDGEDVEFDDGGDELVEVWLRRRALIKGFWCVIIYVCNVYLSTYLASEESRVFLSQQIRDFDSVFFGNLCLFSLPTRVDECRGQGDTGHGRDGDG